VAVAELAQALQKSGLWRDDPLQRLDDDRGDIVMLGQSEATAAGR
jgi:hypothetical protein